MFQKNNGFFLIELLISLSIWILITSILLPIYIHISKQSLNVQKEVESIHLLYELLQRSIVENGVVDSQKIIRGDYEFTVVNKGDFPLREVCIFYEDYFLQQIETCEQIE